MAPLPKKRVRTGCLKCRVRRRKCDEGKPRCQRCIAGGFDCQYGTRLCFLQKNNITVAEPRPLTALPSLSYRTITFVGENDSAVADAGSSRVELVPESPSGDTFVPEQPIQARATLPSTPPQDIPKDDSAAGFRPGETASLNLHGDKPHRNNIEPHASSRGYTSTDGYEIALDVLLSLSGSNGVPTLEDVSNAETPATDFDPPHQSATAGTTQVALQDTEPSKLNTHHTLSDSRIIELLRYYRYEVAPWLDICDLGLAFGISVSCMINGSDPVLYAILSLAAALTRPSDPERGAVDEIRELETCAESSRAQVPAKEVDARVVCLALACTRHEVCDGTGDRPRLPVAEILDLIQRPLVSVMSRTMIAPLYYLVLRLELSRALVNDQPISLPLRALLDSSSLDKRTDLAKRVFQCVTDSLVLCVRVINLLHDQPDNFSERGSSLVHRWTMLVEELGLWYSRRSQEFKPIVEIEEQDVLFPTMLFTNGAALLSNQLYHTAMLLLLRNKPRTVRFSSRRKPWSVSPLWHAQRVCGIALDNNCRESWDPSLLASFIVASKGMTHGTQHQVIMNRLDEVQRLTGWDVSRHKALLREDWGV